MADALRSEHPLFERLERPPRCLALADLPTPVQRAAWWDEAGREVWIKRDDLSSALYGGGKVRKLELALGNPPYAGAEPIASSGGIGSNHLVALALFLRERQRRLHAIVFDQPPTDHALDNLAVVASCDASFWYVHRRWELPIAWAAFRALQRPELGVMMTPGASTTLACVGFVMAGLELAGQIERGELPCPRTIFVTGGTGGASAGLAIGLAIAGVSTHLRIVSAVEPVLFNLGWLELRLHEIHGLLVGRGLRSSGARRLLADAGVTWSIDHAHLGKGYGAPTPEGKRIAARAAEHGVHLDPTYTAKCAAALDEHRLPGPALLWLTHASNDIRGHIVPGWRDRLPLPLREHLVASGA